MPSKFFNFQSTQDNFFVKHIKSVKRKALKKVTSEELIPKTWHSKRWWNVCMSEDETKEIEPIFNEGLQKCTLVVYNKGVLKYFGTENCVLIFLSGFL